MAIPGITWPYLASHGQIITWPDRHGRTSDTWPDRHGRTSDTWPDIRYMANTRNIPVNTWQIPVIYPALSLIACKCLLLLNLAVY